MLRVAVGVITNAAGEVLVARRHDHLHQGGLWEFPGGKVAAGESVEEALARELHEELGIRVEHAVPLVIIEHDYPERQPLRWLPVTALDPADFPAANAPIIGAIQADRAAH